MSAGTIVAENLTKVFDMSHSHVGVEHLFLAVIRDRDAVPAQVLGGMVDLEAVESALIALMNSDGYKSGTTHLPPPEAAG